MPRNGKPAKPRGLGRKDGVFRSTDHEGDNGPVETPPTYEEWCRMTGFNPETGQYDRVPENVPPVVVLQSPNPDRRDTRAAKAAARQGSGECPGEGGGDPLPIGLIGRYDYDDGDPDGWYAEYDRGLEDLLGP